MKYIEKINKIIENVNKDLVDFQKERIRGTVPTLVSSEFLTNKEQGDWAEKTLQDVINQASENFVAVKYGKDDDIIAGEEGFKEFYEAYQNELDTIGKRPDLLIFEKKDFPYDTTNISHFNNEELDKIVPKAKCGIEVRSSAFLINHYEDFISAKVEKLVEQALTIKDVILNNYSELLKSKNIELYNIINEIDECNINTITFKIPAWRSNEELRKLTKMLKALKAILTEIHKRNFLSITPKVEDLKVVYKWTQKYNVPHYYVQVFFDKAYGISFEKILELISNPTLKGKSYFIESDVKNQNKTTIKIQAGKENNILESIELPEHYSELRELGRGRLLFYVKFKNSKAIINMDGFEKLFGFKLV